MAKLSTNCEPAVELTAQQLARVLAAAGRSQVESGVSEKRRAERVQQRARVAIYPIENGQLGAPRPVLIRNLSQRGLGIVHNHPFVNGQQFVVQFADVQGTTVQMLCTVVHCKSVRDDQYQIGAEMTCLLRDAALPPTPVSEEEIQRIRQSVLG